MTLTSYFIFLACLLFFNIAVLYCYFLHYETNLNENIHNEHVTLTLKYAYFIQITSLLIGYVFLFFFSEDKTWFYETNFLYFLGLVILFALFGFLNKLKGGIVLSSLFELAGIIGFIFLLPEINLPFKTSLPHEAILALTGLGWFVFYKFFCILADRFEEIISLQSLHMGFSVFPILLFLTYSPIPLLQVPDYADVDAASTSFPLHIADTSARTERFLFASDGIGFFHASYKKLGNVLLINRIYHF